MGKLNLASTQVAPRLTKLGYYLARSTEWDRHLLQDQDGKSYRWLVGRLPDGTPDWGFHSLADVLVFVDQKEIDAEYRESWR